jgi:uncharacterized membrane protein YphA (DoxX/SURF4 family)
MLLRRIARPLLAGIFISGGIAALRDPEGHAKLAAETLDKVTGLAPVDEVPSNVTLVRVDAAVKVGAGALLATGKAPRLAAGALAASLVPTTMAGHRFWEVNDPNQRMDQQVHFLKNLALLGGLMLASADTEGKPSMAYRARRAGKTTSATAELFHRDITEGVGQVSRRAGNLRGQLVDVAGRVGEQASGAADQYGPKAAELAGRANERLVGKTKKARAKAEKLTTKASRRADKAAKRSRKANKDAEKLSRRARKQLAKQIRP